MVRLEDLRTFCAVVEQRGFSHASAVLGVTQPAVSQRIRSLERFYGRELLHRTGPAVVPTEAGTVVYEYALKVLNLFEESRQCLQQAEDPLTGQLTIGSSTGLGEWFLPRLMARFQKEHPQARVLLHIDDSEAILESIVRHRFDLGFVGTARRDGRLRFEPFASDPLVLVVGASHELAKTPAITRETFLSVPLAVQQAGSGATRALQDALAQEDLEFGQLNVVLEVGLQESAKNAVLAGCGGTVISRLGVMEELRDGSLVELKIEDLRFERSFYVAFRRSWPVSRLGRKFLAEARGEARRIEL